MPTMQAASESQNTQYHHFIPQFILRNFSHPYHSPNGKSRTRRSSGRGQIAPTNCLYPGDRAIHILNLCESVPTLSESSIRRSFGLADMYRDFSRISDQHYLENALSKLESRASTIITRIRKAFEANNLWIWITRPDRNVLRKFLFIMKYRGKGYHRRFTGDGPQDYVEDDKESFLQYMRDGAFQTPRDVWFHSIKTILDLKLDVHGTWRERLMDQMYPGDARGFILHTEMMYLAICTPSSADVEFVLTENCYNIYEGPSTLFVDPTTGETQCGLWTSYHEFSPIAPRLMIVLRSFILPNAEEDANDNIRHWRESMYHLNITQHANPRAAGSILADLPIRKARNSYSAVSTQGVELLAGEDGSQRLSHRFCFPFFKISTEHVNKINAVMLDNAQECQAIAFTSRSALRATLEHYLTLPADQGFKIVSKAEDDPKVEYLTKLEHVLHHLGSQKRLVRGRQDTTPVADVLVGVPEEKLGRYLPDQSTGFMQLYMKLGGSAAMMWKDMDQARRMVNLRIKIDVCSQALDESKREQIRENLRDLFCQLLPRRLWYYLKRLRLMLLTDPSDVTDNMSEYMDGPEDVLVKVSHIIQPDMLGRLMHFAVMQHVFMVKHPDLDISAEIGLNEDGVRRLVQTTEFAFRHAGRIHDCGIDILQAKAISVAKTLRDSPSCLRKINVCWTETQNIEMMTRILVRKDMERLLGDCLAGDDLQGLKEVVFDILYPTCSEMMVARAMPWSKWPR